MNYKVDLTPSVIIDLCRKFLLIASRLFFSQLKLKLNFRRDLPPTYSPLFLSPSLEKTDERVISLSIYTRRFNSSKLSSTFDRP